MLAADFSFTGKGLFTASGDASLLAGDLRTRFGVNASHLRYSLGGDLAALGYSGVANTFGAYARNTLISRPNSELAVQAGARVRATQSDISLLNSHGRARIDELQFQLTGRLDDIFLGRGQSRFRIQGTLGRLRLRDSASQLYDDYTARTAGAFGKVEFSFEREQLVSKHLGVLAQGRGQWTGRNLDPSEKMSLSDSSALRAFSPGQLTADSAIVLSLEGRAEWNLPSISRGKAGVSLFADKAWARRNERPWAGYGASPDLNLTDAGTSAWLMLGPAQMKVSWAREIGTPLKAGVHQDRFWFTISGAL